MTLTGNTSSNTSDLQIVNGYAVNNVQGLGGGIVNPSNVRGFLNDTSNQIIINDFFSFLTGTTTTIEFAEIYNSDQKLSDVFNEYYQSSVLNNQFPSTAVLDNTLAGTTGITVVHNQFFELNGVAPLKGLENIPLSINDSTRLLNVYSALTTYTMEPSYYVPVFIVRNHSQSDRVRAYFDNIQNVLEEFVPSVDSGTTVGTGGNSYGSYGINSNSYSDYSQQTNITTTAKDNTTLIDTGTTTPVTIEEPPATIIQEPVVIPRFTGTTLTKTL